MAHIVLENVYKVFEDGTLGVKDFNLEISDKEFVIFVGPSGCGKSTTLRMIAGLEEISKGRLFIDGQMVNNVEPCHRDIAMVFQNYALYPHMTVGENIAYSLKLKKMAKAEIRSKVEAVAEILNISKILDRKPKQLSGGQRQRVAMGRAIVRSSKVFLMDEPLSNLDAKLRNQMRIEILKLHRSLEATFIYVTHDQVEAMTLGTRIVVMKDGEIQQVAAPKELYDYPANAFVAGFIGSPPMNFIQGECYVVNQVPYVRIGAHELMLTEEQGEVFAKNKYSGPVLVGVRPEDVFVPREGPADSVVTAYEMLGGEAYLHFKYFGVEMILRTDSHETFNINDRIRVGFKVEKLHFFNVKTEKRLV